MSENLKSTIPQRNSKQLDQVQVIIGKKQKQAGPILDLLAAKFNHDNNLNTISDRANEEDEKLTLNNVNTLTTIKGKEKNEINNTNNIIINNITKISPQKILKKEKTTIDKSTFDKENINRVNKAKVVSYNEYKNNSYENDETFFIAKIAEKSTNIREDNINDTSNSIKIKNTISQKNSNKIEFIKEIDDQSPDKMSKMGNLINLKKIEKETINKDSENENEKDYKKIISNSHNSPNLQNIDHPRNNLKGKSVKIRPKIFQAEGNGENSENQNFNSKDIDELSEASTFNNIHTVNIKLANPNARHNRTSSHNNSTNLTNLNININFQQILPNEKFTNSSKINRNYKNAKIKSSSKTSGNALTSTNLTNYLSPKNKENEDEKEDLKKELEDYCDEIDNNSRLKIPTDHNLQYPSSPGRSSISSPSKNWKKISNLFRTMKSLHRYETKNLVDESGFDCEMKDYKERLFGNTIKMRIENNDNDNNENDDGTKSLFDSKLIQLIEQQAQQALEEKKINYKEEIYRIIVDGDTTAVNKIDKLFRSDPEYYLLDENDPNFKFNTPLGNGKTLLYIACQEGKIDIVRYLLEKKINAFVKSKLDAKDGESPLGVAARWNYANIVSLLLEKVQYRKEHILEVLDMQGLTKRIRKTLKRHYKANFKIQRFACCG
jgi:hypothetical protein